MKRWLRAGLLGLVVVAVPIGDLAWAHGGRGGGRHRPHWGLFIGAPLLLYPWWYRSYPPVVVAPAEPPIYVERGDVARGGGYWYHCDAPEGYYPYVKECPGGWQRETPRAPPE